MRLIDLEKIDAALVNIKPLPEPFNGASRVVLARDAFEAISPHMHVAFPWGGPKLEMRDVLPPGHGYGFRKWKDGDDPEQKFMGEVIVWVLAPKSVPSDL